MTQAPAQATARVVLLGDMRDLHHHGCEAVVAECVAALGDRNLTPDLIVPGLDWRSVGDACLEAGLVVINGEGALHHARPAVDDVLELARLRRASKRPTALINSSWFANRPDQTAALTSFDLLALREPSSQTNANAAGLNARLVPDLAIRHALRTLSLPIGDGAILYTDSTEPAKTRALARLGRSHHWDYLPMLARPDHSRPGAKSRKIRQRCRIGRLLGPLAPLFLSDRYLAHLAGERTTAEVLRRFAHSRGVVTGRFHAVCFALGLRIPFVAVASNTPKIEALISAAGLDPALRLARSLEPNTHPAPYTTAEHRSLDAFLAESTSAWEALFDSIAALPIPPAT